MPALCLYYGGCFKFVRAALNATEGDDHSSGDLQKKKMILLAGYAATLRMSRDCNH